MNSLTQRLTYLGICPTEQLYTDGENMDINIQGLIQELECMTINKLINENITRYADEIKIDYLKIIYYLGLLDCCLLPNTINYDEISNFVAYCNDRLQDYQIGICFNIKHSMYDDMPYHKKKKLANTEKMIDIFFDFYDVLSHNDMKDGLKYSLECIKSIYKNILSIISE